MSKDYKDKGFDYVLSTAEAIEKGQIIPNPYLLNIYEDPIEVDYEKEFEGNLSLKHLRRIIVEA